LLIVLFLAESGGAAQRFGVPSVIVAALAALPFPAVWALFVWNGEWRQPRAYHWSLPVPRAAHDLARVAAGAVVLMGAYLVLAVAGALVAARHGGWERFAAIGPGWISFFAGSLASYLVFSPVALWCHSPAVQRGIVIFFAVWIVAAIVDLDAVNLVLDRLVWLGDWGIGPAIVGGFEREGDVGGGGSLASAAVWIAVGIAVTCLAATWRPSDLARLVRRT
jgi:hypothetical protein